MRKDDLLKSTISKIEDGVASGAFDAMMVFTKMRCLIAALTTPQPGAEPVAYQFIVRFDGGLREFAALDYYEQVGETLLKKIPLYGHEVLDLLRRETAKNERIVGLLREPSDEELQAATLAYQESPCHDLMGPMEDAIAAFAVALLAEVEKEKK
jgi:hypothetical protein